MQSSAVDHKVPCKPPNCILCLFAVVPNTDSFSLLLPRIEAQLAWDCLLSKPEYLILHKYHLTCATVASNTYMDTVRSHVLQVKVYWAYWFTSEQPPPLPHQPSSSPRAYRFTSASPSLTAIHFHFLQRTLDGWDASRPERHSQPSGCLNWCRVISMAKANTKRTFS